MLESFAATPGYDLSNRVAVVTGASGGLGGGIARGLAGQGATVVAVARRGDRLQTLREELGQQLVPLTADVTSREDVARLARRLRDAGTPADILVNAAGVFGPIAPIVEGDAERWIATLMTNTVAPYLTCRALAPAMVSAGWGRILNVTSAASLHPPGPLNSAYATSKVALNQLTRHLAAELVGTGVTANVLHPGDVKTPMWEDIRDRAQAMGPGGEPFASWADWVGQTGGDPPQKAVDLVLAHVTSPEAVTGRFLWIDEPLQAPIPAWEDDEERQPWLT